MKKSAFVITLVIITIIFASCSINKQEQLKNMLTAHKWKSQGNSMSYNFYDSGICKYGGYFDKVNSNFEITEDNTLIFSSGEKEGTYIFVKNEEEAGKTGGTWYVTNEKLYIGSSEYYAVDD